MGILATAIISVALLFATLQYPSQMKKFWVWTIGGSIVAIILMVIVVQIGEEIGDYNRSHSHQITSIPPLPEGSTLENN